MGRTQLNRVLRVNNVVLCPRTSIEKRAMSLKRLMLGCRMSPFISSFLGPQPKEYMVISDDFPLK
jgi:hypothetical protein